MNKLTEMQQIKQNVGVMEILNQEDIYIIDFANLLVDNEDYTIGFYKLDDYPENINESIYSDIFSDCAFEEIGFDYPENLFKDKAIMTLPINKYDHIFIIKLSKEELCLMRLKL